MLCCTSGTVRTVNVVADSCRWAFVCRISTKTCSRNFCSISGVEVTNENPPCVAMARLAAELVDNGSYSMDFRLEALEVLDLVLGRLKELSESEAPA